MASFYLAQKMTIPLGIINLRIIKKGKIFNPFLKY